MTIRLAALVTTSVAFAIVVLSFSVREPSGPTGQIAERREASEGVAPSEALRHIAASSPASAGDPADARRVEERGAQLEEASDSEAPSPYYGYFVYADEGVKRVDVDLEPGHSIVFGEPPAGAFRRRGGVGGPVRGGACAGPRPLDPLRATALGRSARGLGGDRCVRARRGPDGRAGPRPLDLLRPRAPARSDRRRGGARSSHGRSRR